MFFWRELVVMWWLVLLFTCTTWLNALSFITTFVTFFAQLGKSAPFVLVHCVSPRCIQVLSKIFWTFLIIATGSHVAGAGMIHAFLIQDWCPACATCHPLCTHTAVATAAVLRWMFVAHILGAFGLVLVASLHCANAATRCTVRRAAPPSNWPPDWPPVVQGRPVPPIVEATEVRDRPTGRSTRRPTDEATVEQLMWAIREMDSDERVALRVALDRTVPRFDRPHVSL